MAVRRAFRQAVGRLTRAAVWPGLVLAAASASGQDRGRHLADLLKANTVKITASDPGLQTGFGLIVGETADELYVVTAHHVVKDQREVRVTLCSEDGPERPAIVDPHSSEKDDVAVLRLSKPAAFRWEGVVFSIRDPRLDDLIWVVGRPGECGVPRAPGYVSKPREGWRFRIDNLDVSPGSSGAPLVGHSGVVGILLTDARTGAEGILLERIRRVVEDANGPWALQQADSSPAASVKDPRRHSPGVPIPWTGRRLSWHTLLSGAATGGAVLWQRSADRDVRRALDRYVASTTASEALASRGDVRLAQGRRDSAKKAVIGASALTGLMLAVDLARKPPPVASAREAHRQPPDWEWRVGLGPGPAAGGYALAFEVRFGSPTRGGRDGR